MTRKLTKLEILRGVDFGPSLEEIRKLRITKILRCDPEMVSCLNCLCNYPACPPVDPPDAVHGRFCQVHSFHVDPDDIEECQSRAKECKQWMPREISRSTCDGEEIAPDRWYEKDSMG